MSENSVTLEITAIRIWLWVRHNVVRFSTVEQIQERNGMNQTELKRRRREQSEAAVLSVLMFVATWAAWHWGWIEALNPFDGK